MSHPANFQSPNRFLNVQTQEVYDALRPHLKVVNLKFGDIVASTGEEVTHVYFPHIGVISLVVEMEIGDMIETAMVGRDGVANGTSALDGKVSLHKGIVQVEGAASIIDPNKLREIADEHSSFRALLIRHEQVVLAQAQQSAGCNASHTTEARMCRWLLRIRDLTESDEMRLTQQYLAQMLGVRRTSVSLIANTLQKAGLITYRRGVIRLVDLEALRASSCECYERVQSHYRRLLS